METKTAAFIEWSKSATSRSIAYDHPSRQLKAMSLVIFLRANWLNPGTLHLTEEQILGRQIDYIISQISPELDKNLNALLKSNRKQTEFLAPQIEVADFLKNNIFGCKTGIRRKLQSIAKENPGGNATLQEKRAYIEMLSKTWNEVLSLPKELIVETSNGIIINLQNTPGERGLKDIWDFLDSSFPDYPSDKALSLLSA
jgi:hypothetical protein